MIKAVLTSPPTPLHNKHYSLLLFPLRGEREGWRGGKNGIGFRGRFDMRSLLFILNHCQEQKSQSERTINISKTYKQFS